MTAVEWLLNEINKLTGLTINPDEPIVEQAKQMEKEQSKQEYEYIGECKGNDGNGCFMDSPGHNCGCFVRIPKQEPTIEQIDQNNPVTRGSTALVYRDGTPMRKYNSLKLKAIEMENKQTAVEWLIEQLRQLSHSLEAHLGMGDIRVTQGMIDDFEEQAKKMEIEQNKKEKCWVIRNSAKHILCVHKTINDEQLKDYRKQGLYTDEYVLLY